MTPKLSNTLPYRLAIARALLVIAVFVLIKVSHDPQAWLFFIIVFVVDYPTSIGIKYLPTYPPQVEIREIGSPLVYFSFSGRHGGSCLDRSSQSWYRG